MAQPLERIGLRQRLVEVMQERGGLDQGRADRVALLLDLLREERGNVRNRGAVREVPLGRVERTEDARRLLAGGDRHGGRL